MREVRLGARGHADVTGRHDKTLELTAEDAITARATCILGVAAGPLPGGLPGLRGTVRLTLAAGGVSASLTGQVNPAYASADRLVVRRSDQRDPDTFLVGASAAAADLPADLLAALRVPGAPVAVTAAETVPPPPPVVLVLTPGEVPAAVARLAAQADLVVDLTGRGAPPPAVPLAAPRRHGVPGAPVAARTVVVLADDLGEPVTRAVAAVPGARVAVWPPAPGADLLLAAGLSAVPLLHVGPLPGTPAGRRDLAARIAAAAVPTTVDIPPADLPAGPGPGTPAPASAASLPAPGSTSPGASTPLLNEVEQRRTHRDRTTDRPRSDEKDQAPTGPAWLADLRTALPAYRLLVPDPAVGWGVAVGEDTGDLRGLRATPRIVLVPPDGPRPVPVDPAELARLLRAAGRSGRDAAAVLTGLGVPRKDAYRLATDGS